MCILALGVDYWSFSPCLHQHTMYNVKIFKLIKSIFDSYILCRYNEIKFKILAYF